MFDIRFIVITYALANEIYLWQFIDERLDLLNSGRGFNDEFEVECNHYADKLNTGSGQKLKQQYRDWAKTVKKEGGAFFKNMKDKVTLTSAVNLVCFFLFCCKIYFFFNFTAFNKMLVNITLIHCDYIYMYYSYPASKQSKIYNWPIFIVFIFPIMSVKCRTLYFISFVSRL